MSSEIVKGIADVNDAIRRGWIVGPFMDEGLQKTTGVAVKFEIVEKG